MKDILRGRNGGIKIDTTKTIVFTQDILTQVRYFLLNYSVVKRIRTILSTIVNINKKMEFRIVPTKNLGYTFNLNDHYRILLLKVRRYNLPKPILT
jgi:hypothetical protein